MAFVSGCDRGWASVEAEPLGKAGLSQRPPVEVDAGVLLAGRAGYLCLPLEQVGLEPDADIDALQSSCDCIKPKVVGCASSGGIGPADRVQRAILLEYVDAHEGGSSSHKESSERRAVDLAVAVDVVLAGGEHKSFTVNLLHSWQVPEKESVAKVEVLNQ